MYVIFHYWKTIFQIQTNQIWKFKHESNFTIEVPMTNQNYKLYKIIG